MGQRGRSAPGFPMAFLESAELLQYAGNRHHAGGTHESRTGTIAPPCRADRCRQYLAADRRRAVRGSGKVRRGKRAPYLRGFFRRTAEIMGRHSAKARHRSVSAVRYTKGKNASDIALVIDAMDLLHSGRFDGFCLVSSDSDFTRLASRLREQGADVYGFGAQKTPESFRQACRRFIYTENLVVDAARAASGVKAQPLERPSSAIPLL